MIDWKCTLLNPNAVDAAYANQPVHSRAVYDGLMSEVKRLETLLLEGSECGASRCPKCERVVDGNDLVTDESGSDVACWLCERA